MTSLLTVFLEVMGAYLPESILIIADKYRYVATLEARIQTLEAQLQAANSRPALGNNVHLTPPEDSERRGHRPAPQEHVRSSS